MTTAQPLTGVERRAWVAQIMGMPLSVHLRGPGSRTPEAAACVAAAYDRLRAVDRMFSTYRPDSSVRRIGRGELALRDAHPWVRAVAELCRDATRRTGGLFDAWYAGHFDPTGLVKGWAVEQVAATLAEQLPCDVSVNAGGDVAVRAGRPAQPWRIGVEDPHDPSSLVGTVELVEGGVATSGTTRRGRHLLDPRDGTAADTLLSVTVTGPSLLWADVLATAAFVSGEGAAELVARHPGYRCLVVAR